MGVYSSDVPFKSLYVDYTSQKQLKRLSGFVISDWQEEKESISVLTYLQFESPIY